MGNKWLRKNKTDMLVWSLCIGLIVWALYPILSNQIIAGWDLTSHFYLQTKMIDFLKTGAISGYDANWFGGYPVFTFYGPFPYIFIALLHFLSFGTISVNFLFNLFLFLLPFFFLISIYCTSRIWFDKKAGSPALLFSLFFLFSSKDYAHFGMGINAEIFLGLFSSLFAISLMVFLLGILGKQRLKKSKILLLIGGFLLAMIILTHALTTIFTGVLMVILFLTDRKQLWKPIIFIFLLGLLFSSFWLVPFLLNFKFSSAQMIGMLPMSKDPLFVLYPIPAIVLLICSVVGIVKLFKSKNHFWAYAFIATLIILPRDYMVYVINLPIHYYRLIPHIFVLNIFLAAVGFLYILKSFSKIIFRISIFGILLLSVFAMAFSEFDMRDDYNFFFKEYDDYEISNQMLEYINELNPTGRIAVEIIPENQAKLGTPHFFTTFLPLKYNIPVIPGLLAESSLSSEFIMPSLVRISDSIAWGNVSLLNDKNFKKQNERSMLKRLGLYNVEYILLNENDAQNLLQKVKDNELIFQKKIGNFELLKLTNFKPLVESTTYPPFLFIDNGGMDFRTFSKEWFKIPELFKYPVIYTEKSVEEIFDYDLSKIGGFIVSLPENDQASDLDLTSFNKEIVFIHTNDDISKLEEIFSKSYTSDLDNVEIFPEIKENERLKFFSESGTFINYSYFPRWKSKEQGQTVFWATPTMMFVFGKGETEIIYK